jgi:hypothetical protein
MAISYYGFGLQKVIVIGRGYGSYRSVVIDYLFGRGFYVAGVKV